VISILPNKSNFVFTFEILGMLSGGFWGYVIAVTLQASSFDPGLLAGSLFVTLLFGMINPNTYVALVGAPIGFFIGYFLNRKKLGLEMGLIAGMVVLTPVFLGDHLLQSMFLISYVCMVIGIFAGKVAGTKIGLIIDESNDAVEGDIK